MGHRLGKMLQTLFGYSGRMKILLLGLDNAGKTTILYKVKLDEIISTAPTVGFNVETVNINEVTFTVWDVGGSTFVRQFWKYYFQNIHGLIYVIDSSDVDRIDEAAQELHAIVQNNEEMHGVPILIVANKQDLPTATSCSKLAKLLRLDELNNIWYVLGTCAITGEGIYDSMKQIHNMIKFKNSIQNE